MFSCFALSKTALQYMHSYMIVYTVKMFSLKSTFVALAIYCVSSQRYNLTAYVQLQANHTRCSTNLSASGAVRENDVITMTCSITYSGNWAPVMRWFNSATRHNYTDVTTDHHTTTTTEGDNYMTTNETTVTSRLTVTAAAGLHGSEVVSVTYFTPTSLPTNAINVPSYTHNWISPTLDVQCKQ